ncbi:MAG: DNA cytosine methyltransferase [Burkholderiaceae bacterium]|nr:MAG: DNA cytosine methyltransferase [Burkholderiaceae bacterium]
MGAKFDMWIKKLGFNRGVPRLWIETPRISNAGLEPGMRFSIEPRGCALVLKPDAAGSNSVCSKTRNGRTVPVVDINSTAILKPFEGQEVVRVVVRDDGVWIMPLASELAKKERIERLAAKLAAGEAIATASLAHGGGILSHAAHTGLRDEGVQASLGFANEIDEGYALQSTLCNEVSAEANMLVAPLQELAQDEWAMTHLPKVEVLEMGLPCSGASKAGKSKRGITMMESHPEVGHLVVAALAVIQKVQPAVVVLENVEAYSTSASAEILRSQLRDMGYNVSEVVLSARDFGCIENRVRWILVAATDGLAIDAAQAVPVEAQVHAPVLGTMLDPVELDAECWSELSYLKEKEVRDLAAGKGFGMQIVDASSTSVPTIRKHYNKGGSTDPYVQHAVNPNLLRKFTAAEHARIKGVPTHLVEGLPATTAHELMGQGIAYEPLRALFRLVGRSLNALKAEGAKFTQVSAAASRLSAVIG